MRFSASPTNRAVRILAALVIISLGVGMLAVTAMPVALAPAALIAVGGCILCAEVWAYCLVRYRRRDRYDLSLLDEIPGYNGPSRDEPSSAPQNPDWESEEGDVAYCHRCDVSMPPGCAICPQCGAVLGP
jgi:hypothetical protein